jgi:dTDP-4-dehydrorhamnose reductase
MRILVTGAYGQLGRAIKRALDEGAAPEAYKECEATWIDLDSLDITDSRAVKAYFEDFGPFDIVFNCAAFTNVDGCETNFDTAFAANAVGPMNLAIAADACGATFVHVSTDYVFPGNEPGERHETDVPAPISAYGRSKLAGEGLARAYCARTHVCRTAWLYGEGKNFVRTMLRLAESHDVVSVVDDQLGNPTSADDLARELLRIALTEDYGIWHTTNTGTCSWADLAQATFELKGVDCTVKRVSSAEYKQMVPGSADRPAFSSLAKDHLEATIGCTMRPWKEALADYLARQD